LERDPEYRARYDAYYAEQRRAHEEDQRALQIAAEGIPARSPVVELDPVAAAAAAAAAAATRAQKIERNAHLLESIPTFSPHKMIHYATKVIHMWKEEPIRDWACVKAYAVLKYTSPTFGGYNPLLRAVVTIFLQGRNNHPDHATYATVPEEERNAALAALTTALEPFAPMDADTLIPEADHYKAIIRQRRRIEENERRAAAARARQEALLQAEQAARRAQFQRDLRERPVVFERDHPDGTVNLRALAADHQSVHRSSVQTTTHRGVLRVIERPLGEGQETLPEITLDFNDPSRLRFSSITVKERTIAELTHDYFETEAFSIMYGRVLDHVWAYIRGHPNRFDLTIRLGQEIVEGLGQCSNGKMARLINVLQGFDETIEVDPPKEIFQNRIVLLQKRPLAEREAEARALFVEFAIPEAEQAAWLEPLLEEEA
jgi:hypothetical protein